MLHPFSKNASKKSRKRQGAASSRRQVWPNAHRWPYVDFDRDQRVRESLNSTRDRHVVAAWENLSHVEGWSPIVLADVLLLLIETPFVETRHLPALPNFEDSCIDLRPWLCDREKTRELLVRYAEDWTEAVRILKKRGTQSVVLFSEARTISPV